MSAPARVRCGLALTLALPTLLTAGPSTSPAADPKLIAAAVLRLGSPDAREREDATRLLWAAGKAAEPALREAAGGDDPEVAARARQLLDDFRFGLSPDAPAAVIENVRLYKRGDFDSRQRALDALAAAGPEARRPLVRLYAGESDGARRHAILTRLHRLGLDATVKEALADGEEDAAESLLAGAVAEGDAGGAGAAAPVGDYAALLVLRGRADGKIAELEGQAPGRTRDALLTYLYRARGDLAAARKAAARAGNPSFGLVIALEAGDWRPLAAAQEVAPAAGHTADAVNLALAFRTLARDEAGAAAAAAAVVRWADEHPDDAWYAIKALLLAERRDEAIDVARRHGHLRVAFEVLKTQGRLADAMQLADDAAKGNGGPPPRAVGLLAEQRAEAEAGRRAEDRLTVRVMAAQLLWQVGERAKARAAADAVAKAADDMREAYLLRAAVARPRSVKPPAPRPTSDFWQGLSAAEREMGRPDHAGRHALTALAAERELSRVRPSDGSEGMVLQALFPGKGPQTALWWQFFRDKFPDEDDAARLDRVKALLDGKADAEKLHAWAEEVRARYVRPTADKYLSGQRLMGLAETFHSYDRVADAEACLEAAAATHPPSGALMRAGEAAMERGDWERAAEWYARAARQQPDAPAVLYLRGVALRQAGRAAEADQAIARSKLLPLGNDWQRLQLAEAMRKHGDADAAREQDDLAARLGRLDPYGGTATRRVWANHQALAGNFGPAADALQLSLLPVFRMNSAFFQTPPYLAIPAVIHTWRARDRLKAGDFAAAAREADGALDAFPANTDIAIELVTAFDQAGRRGEAEAVFQRSWRFQRQAYELFPSYAQGHNAAAWVAARCGRELDQALADARKAVALDGRNTAFLDTLAEACFRAGRRDEAVELMKKCIEIDPKQAYFQAQLKRFSDAATVPATAPAGGDAAGPSAR